MAPSNLPSGKCRTRRRRRRPRTTSTRRDPRNRRGLALPGRRDTEKSQFPRNRRRQRSQDRSGRLSSPGSASSRIARTRRTISSRLLTFRIGVMCVTRMMSFRDSEGVSGPIMIVARGAVHLPSRRIPARFGSMEPIDPPSPQRSRGRECVRTNRSFRPDGCGRFPDGRRRPVGGDRGPSPRSCRGPPSSSRAPRPPSNR